MNRIIIAAPSYNSSIGGAIVLHKLCHILNNLGYKAYITTTTKLNGQTDNIVLNEGYNTRVATELDVEKDIVLYPEIERGNPLGAKNIVRYILSTAHLVPLVEGNHASTWGEDDFWLYLHGRFYDEQREKNILHVIDTKVDLYKDLGLERKIEACFTLRKRTGENLKMIHPEGAIEIGYGWDDSRLMGIFNSCKKFYSYDTETYLNTLAALCGCESIIIPYPTLSKEETKKQPSFRYGIKYGENDELTDPGLLKEYLHQLEEEQIENTHIMFQKIFNYFSL